MTQGKDSSIGRTEVSREPWWSWPPSQGEDELKAEWGWLVWYDSGAPVFDTSTRPTDEQIKNRKSCRLPETCLDPPVGRAS